MQKVSPSNLPPQLILGLHEPSLVKVGFNPRVEEPSDCTSVEQIHFTLGASSPGIPTLEGWGISLVPQEVLGDHWDPPESLCP